MNYLLIGDGRLSRHFQFYFSQLGLRYKVWSRHSNIPLQELVRWCDVLLLAIGDDQIADFIENNKLTSTGKALVHFSGAQFIEGTVGLHPLMTFGPELYEGAFYAKVPFVTDADESTIRRLFPKMRNPVYKIKASQKALYHAYCVAAGNFPQILWSEVRRGLQQDIGLPPETMTPFLQTTMNNFLKYGDSALTGPLVRGDNKTQVRNLDALHGSPLQDLYFAFINLFKTSKIRRGRETHDSVTL